MTPEQRHQKLQEIAARVVARLEREWPATDAHINELEDLAERVGRELMQEITAELLRERAPRRDSNQTACACGSAARYRSLHPLTLVTAHGRLPIERPYFYCDTCHTGQCPRDQEWGLGPAATTPTVQALVARLAAEMTYTQLPRCLQWLRLPFALDSKSAELIAQRLGARVQGAPPPRAAPAERTIVAAVDGVMLPTRAGYREARAGVVYEPDWEAGRTADECAALRKEYLATLDSRESLVAAVAARVEQRRPTPETKGVAMGDGAHWIWEQYARHLPHRVEILDFYHVCQHLWKVGQAWHGEGTAAARDWVKRQKQQLLTVGPGPLLRSLRAWQPESAAGQEVRRQELGYFGGNQERMQYPAYLEQGYPLGSGAVEGACKHVVTERFKKAGMRWNQETAEPLLHLRAALLTQPDLDLRSYVSSGHAPPICPN